MALEKALQGDLGQLRNWMSEHDRTLSSRAKNLLDTLHEFRRTDIHALFEKNAQLAQKNTELANSLASLRQQVEVISNAQIREKTNSSMKLISRAFHIFSACKLTPAWVQWIKFTTLRRELAVSEVKRAALFSRVFGNAALHKFHEAFYAWSNGVNKLRAREEKKRSSVRRCLEIADQEQTRRNLAVLRRWKDNCDWIYHQANRHRLHEMIHDAHCVEDQITVVTRELTFLRDDGQRLEGTTTRLHGEACAKIDDASRRNMRMLNAESKRIDSTLSRISLESIPKLNARVAEVELASSEAKVKLDEAAEKLEHLDARLIDAEDTQTDIGVRMEAAEQSLSTVKDQVEVLREAQDSSSNQARGTQTLLDDVTQTVSCLQTDLQETNAALRQHVETMGAELKRIGRAQTKCDEAVDANRCDIDEQAGALGDLTYEVRMKIAKKPDPQTVVNCCAEYEDLACDQNYSPEFPESIPPEVSVFATAVAHYIAETANAEALERVFAGSNPDELVYAEVQLEARRAALRDAVRAEVTEETGILRTGTGATRLSARQKFIGRMMEAIDVALTKFEAVVTLANTRFGKIKAIPSCVACDRPLPTRLRRDPKERNANQNPYPEATAGADRTQAVRDPSGQTEGPRNNSTMPSNLMKTAIRSQDETPVVSRDPPGDTTLPKDDIGAMEPFVKRGGFKMPPSGKRANELRHSTDSLPQTTVRKEFMLSGTQGDIENLNIETLPRGKIRPRPRSAVGIRGEK